MSIIGTVVWAQPREGKTVAGVAFTDLGDAAKKVLAKLKVPARETHEVIGAFNGLKPEVVGH